mgnify:CR=1 FL=1
MSSKENILSAIRNSIADIKELYLPDYQHSEKNENVQESFLAAVAAVGGKQLEVLKGQEIHHVVATLFPTATQRYSTLPDAVPFNTVRPDELWYPHELADLDVLILRGQFGVAENGAVWLSEKEIPIRIMPFITKHLVLVVDPASLVGNMHEAYDRIADKHDEFGVFISGPSKTADIEQTLVIGAQGPLTLHVVLHEG